LSDGITGEVLHVDSGYHAMGSPGRMLDQMAAGRPVRA
jgi:enoyl-[acyl-carrier protein] reductase I